VDVFLGHSVVISTLRVSNAPGNPGNLLELCFLLEIFWKFVKSPGNILAEFVCLLLLWLTIHGFVFNCNCNC